MPRRPKAPPPATAATTAPAPPEDPVQAAVNMMFKRPRGRPPRYPTAAQLEKIEALARAGMSRRGIAGALGVSRDWLAAHARDGIDHAIDRGTAMLEYELQLALLTRIRGGDITAIIWAQKSLLGRSEVSAVVHVDVPGRPSTAASPVDVGIFLPANGREVPGHFLVVDPPPDPRE